MQKQINQGEAKQTKMMKTILAWPTFFEVGQSIKILLLILVILATFQAHASNDKQTNKNKEGFNRKSIVFDMKTPKVFYCPQEKQSDSSKMIVKAKPLDRLCEFQGKTKPRSMPSDCYQDVDETEFACEEKKRFMLRLDLSSEIDAPEVFDDLDHILSRNKKKPMSSGKKF